MEKKKRYQDNEKNLIQLIEEAQLPNNNISPSALKCVSDTEVRLSDM